MENFKVERIHLLMLVLSLILGMMLRFYGLESLGPWSDELASLYFSEHLELVFIEETHPPLFYLYLKPFLWIFGPDVLALRIVIAITGFCLVLYSIKLASKILSANELTIFSILLLLCQVDIVHSRMIRHYSIFLNLGLILVLLNFTPKRNLILKFVIGFALAGIHPFGFLVPLSLAINDCLFNKETKANAYTYLSSLIPVSIYYALKIWSTGKSFTNGYFGSGEKPNYLLEDIIFTFTGEHFPKINVFPVPKIALILSCLFILAVFLGGLWMYIRTKKLNPYLRYTVILIITSVAFTELFSAVVKNVRVGRYFVFLTGPLILSFVSIFKNYKFTPFAVFALQLGILVSIDPMITYEGEREAMTFFTRMKDSNPDLGFVLCGNKFQYQYYLKSKHRHCIEQYEKLKSEKKSFVFVDLNGFGKPVIKRIFKDYKIGSFHKYGNSYTAVAYFKE